MKFFKLFPLAILPFTAFAIPAPDAVSKPALELTDYQLASSLVARQNSQNLSNLGDLLGDLTKSLGAVKDLLSPESLNNIQTLVTDASYLLKQPTAKQTKELIGTVSSLLGSKAVKDLVDQLPELLNDVGGLVTPALVNNVTDILGNAHELLTADFVGNTKGLINDVAPLVSAISQVITALLSSILG
ncbi:hypothetical protein P170DRAFT_427864 [Aspergillus steynii IBT 23096]|uniref:Antigenic cell wall galactomanno protein n=1 Tax=Aspergillus steynii IBT 23096 TaxID=1392250 RepID=A0A2I2G0Y7_9EURO|nr:uncharacterized protein P170DRAFT_427864 [Aspergillus steynii IBT 23096]PLB46555.1 hypothetical protein P170DRAFT_427864 [Aspergillus steynii IBT 23096]